MLTLSGIVRLFPLGRSVTPPCSAIDALPRESLERAHHLRCLDRQTPPGRFRRAESPFGPDPFERLRGVEKPGRREVARRPLQYVRRFLDTLRVPEAHRRFDRGQAPRTVVEEDGDDIVEQRPVAAGAPSARCDRCTPPSRGRSCGGGGRRGPGRPRLLLHDGQQHFAIDRLGQVTVHPGAQTLLAVAVHGSGSHRDDAG